MSLSGRLTKLRIGDHLIFDGTSKTLSISRRGLGGNWESIYFHGWDDKALIPVDDQKQAFQIAWMISCVLGFDVQGVNGYANNLYVFKLIIKT